MGLCAGAGDAQSNPQMAMKPLSFKLCLLREISRAVGISRALPQAPTLAPRYEQVNCIPAVLPIQWSVQGEGHAVRRKPIRLLVWDQRDGLGSAFVAAAIG
jgi:hypothetical protein